MTAVMAIGATGLVGGYVTSLLAAGGHDVIAVSRRPPEVPAVDRVTWHRADLTNERDVAGLPDCRVVISTLPIWLTAELVESLSSRGLRRLVAFSSTSALTKSAASDPQERELAARLSAGEEALRSAAAIVSTTILRPTMIYARRGDRNCERIADQLIRFPVFPLVGGGRGRRQPVHAEDLALAAIAVLDRAITAGCTYALGGGEVLTVREMVARIGVANGLKARFVSVPLAVARRALKAAAVLPRFRSIPVGALERMTKDLVFDIAQAEADFGYTPRLFDPPDYRRAA